MPPSVEQRCPKIHYILIHQKRNYDLQGTSSFILITTPLLKAKCEEEWRKYSETTESGSLQV
jgi:hypothetical protein